MEAKELATMCDGLDIRDFPTDEITKAASDNGLVIVYGASDDLMEFCGAIEDEFGCYDGGTVKIDKQGLLPSFQEMVEDEDEERLEEYFLRKKGSKEITSKWCDGSEYAWSYDTIITHETFVLADDNNDTKTYCQGIVFSINDL
jgi:hypothetical protein